MPQPPDPLVVSASLEPAAALSSRSSLASSRLSSPAGISSPLTLLPPTTELEVDTRSPTAPSFRLHPVFDFDLDDYFSEPRTPLASSPEPPQAPIRHIVHRHTEFLPPLPSLPVDTSASLSDIGNSATCPAPPHFQRPNPIPPASQPPFLSQPTCTLLRASTAGISMANSSHVSGPAAMPCPLTNAAPFFSGSLDEPINDFLAEYSELADGHGLSERQKCKLVIRYIDPVLRNHWKSMAGYAA